MLTKCFEVVLSITVAHYYSQHSVFSTMKWFIVVFDFIEEQTIFRFICDSKVLVKKYNNFKVSKEPSWSLELINMGYFPTTVLEQFQDLWSGLSTWVSLTLLALIKIPSSFPLSLKQSTKKAGDYEPDKICHWLQLIYPSGQSSHILQFSKAACALHLKKSPNVQIPRENNCQTLKFRVLLYTSKQNLFMFSNV